MRLLLLLLCVVACVKGNPDSGDDTSVYAAGRWYFTPSFAAGLEAELGNDATTYGIGVRWNFAPGNAGRSFSSNR